MAFLSSKSPPPPKEPDKPPNTPRVADAQQAVSRSSLVSASRNRGTRSLVSTGSTGLARKASTAKKSLIGGSQ